jgi:hypothetical protein
MSVIKKQLEYKNMTVSFHYQTKEMVIDHTTGIVTLAPDDVQDLRDALESVGRQPAGTQPRR